MPRIGVNALYLIPGGVGGTEIYLRELLKAIAEIDSSNEYFVFTNLETGADLTPRQSNFVWKQQAVHASFRPGRIVWEQTVLPLEARRYGIDVMFNPGFTAPLWAGCPQVTTFHDLQHKRFPEYFRWWDLPFWKILLWASAHRSRRLIAVSDATRADLLRFYRIAKERVVVIRHGVSCDFLELDRSHPEPILLCVSTLHPHKNLENLLRAFARARCSLKLVLAGMRGFHAKPVEALIGDLDLRGRVRITGWLPREELLDLYRGAQAFVYPSRFEGFGMPVLEALAAGLPVACSDIPPLREVAGDAALYFDPLKVEEMTGAIERIAEAQPPAAGRERAREFTWRRAAEEVVAALVQASTGK